MRNKIILFVVLLISVSIVGCTNKAEEEVNIEKSKEEVENLENAVSEINELLEEAEKTESVLSDNIVGCGEVYKQGDMSYSVIGTRIEETDEGKYLVLKMEAYNSGNDHFDFNPLMNVGMIDENNNEASFELTSPVYKEDVLSGVVLSGGNKIVGEIAFDISEIKSDNYILQIGSILGLKDSIRITQENINKTYDELFENNGVVGEYTIGDTIEFEEVSITFDGVRIEPKNTYNSNYDEEGMGLMVLDMTMVNNSSNSLEFTSVSSFSTIRKVCAADGTELKYEDYSYQNRNWVESGETKSETFGLYYDENVKDFYVILNPDLVNSTNIKIATFSID